jgi:hypothetical protein
MSELERLARYVSTRGRIPMRGLDDVIHAVHGGADAAELRLSDLRVVVAELAALRERLAEAGKVIERLREAGRDNLDIDPCRYDHNDFCQAHYSDKPCRNVTLAEAIAAADRWLAQQTEQQ